MSKKRVYAFPNLITPNRPIEFNGDVCKGCNACIEVCQMDVFMPNPTKRKPPIVMYPDECWYCGSCVKECPLRDKGAIKMNWPLMQKMRWKDKKTGEHFRFGMRNPPPANFKPPVGGWDVKATKEKI